MRPPAPNTPTRITRTTYRPPRSAATSRKRCGEPTTPPWRVPAATALRQPVTFDPATRRLTVGNRSTIVPDVADNNEAMLRGYLALVAQARGTAVASLTEVRQHDVAVLAELLDLDDVDLEARFVRLLGMTPEVAADTRRPHRASTVRSSPPRASRSACS